MKPTIRQLESFQAVIELGNFSRAAERLRMSQPALSQAIRELEDGLGIRLFDRTTRRVELTEAGQVFQATALAGLTEIERAVSMVQDLSNLRRGLVRIAAPPLLAATALPRAIRMIARAHPGLDIRIEDLATDRIVERLRRNGAEIGVGTFPPGEEGLTITPVLRDRLSVFVNPRHRFAGRTELRWAELADQPVVVLTRESGLRLLTEMGFESAGLPLRPAHEVHQIHTALALVAELDAVAILPVYASGALHGRDYRVVALIDPPITRDISLARLRDKTPTPATLAVSQQLPHAIRHFVPHEQTDTPEL